ncbi:MAG: hypothetical protein O9972_13065 [Burkholderiales bacterium]|nr:hypothetical protein [Burkholderiales bacterium]
MTELVVGIKHVRDEIETLPTFGAEMSVAGVVGTAPNADALIFPLNTPVYLTTNEATKILALGTAGTLADALQGISDQLGAGQVAAKVVVVRVEEGEDAAETIGNIVGSEASGTGIWALLDAPTDLGVSPRLICVPGYTQQFVEQGIVSATVGTAGSGGANGTFALAFTGGGGTGAEGTFTVVGGALTAITITEPGSGYTSAPTLGFSASTGLTGAAGTAVRGAVANGVVAAIPTVLNRLRGFLIPDGPATSREAWLAWRETIQSDRILHPSCQDVKVTGAGGSIVTKPTSPRVVGLYIKRDYETDGVPARSVANQAISGIVGVSRPVAFSLTDAANEGQEIVGFNGGIIARGEIGVESAIASGGFVFWGTDTLSEDPLWMFAHVMRLRDYIELSQVRSLRYYLGRFNISVATVNAVLNTMTSGLERLKARGYVLDFRIGFETDKNSPEELRLGNIQVLFKAEEAPVLRKITISSRRYREALNGLVNAVATSLNSLENAA